jgi:hypothetical protein
MTVFYSFLINLIAFKLCINDPDKVLSQFPDMPSNVRNELLAGIKKRLTPQALKIRAGTLNYSN